MSWVFVPNPHARLDRRWVAPYVPLELLLGVATAEAAGARCAVYDVNAQVHRGGLVVGPELWSRAAERLLELTPSAVFLESWTETLHNTVLLAEALRTRAPQLPLVLFGAGSSAVAQTVLETFPVFDGVIRGEVEPALRVLATAGTTLTAEAIGLAPGLCWRGMPERAPAWVADLDALPRAAYRHCLAVGGDSIPVESGRGCAQGCSFCALAGHWTDRYRHRDPAALASEMLALVERYPGSPLDLTQDPVFFNDPLRLHALCAALGKKRVRFSCHARIDRLDPADLSRLAAAGCQSLLFGVESGSSRMQTRIGKQIDLTRALPTARAALAAGIAVHATFILGFPGEEEADLEQTKELALALGTAGAFVEIHLLRAYPGSPLHRKAPRYRFCPPTAAAPPDDAASRKLIERHPALFSASYLIETELETELVFGNWLALSSFAEVLAALAPIAKLSAAELALRPLPETLEQGMARLSDQLYRAVPEDALLDRQTLKDALRLQVALFALSRATPPEPFDVEASLHALKRAAASAVLLVAVPWQLIDVSTDLDLLMDEQLSLTPASHEPAFGLLAKIAQPGVVAHYTQQAALIESFTLDDFGAQAFRLFRGEATLEAVAHTVAATHHVTPKQALDECLDLAEVLCEAGVLRCTRVGARRG